MNSKGSGRKLFLFFQYFLKGLRKNAKTFVKITGLRAVNKARDFANTNKEC